MSDMETTSQEHPAQLLCFTRSLQALQHVERAWFTDATKGFGRRPEGSQHAPERPPWHMGRRRVAG